MTLKFSFIDIDMTPMIVDIGSPLFIICFCFFCFFCSASAYLMTDTNEIDDMGQGARKGSNSHQRFKRPVLEVFSVKVVSSESLSLDGVYGYIMIYTGLPVNLLFRRVRGDPPKINSEVKKGGN